MHLRQAYGREARPLIQDPGQDLPEGQLPGEVVAERAIDAKAAGDFLDRPHGAEREALAKLNCIE
jgi:hypothetical protein